MLYHTIREEFNTELCSDNIKFIDDKSVEKINDDGHALCLFGEPITGSMCTIFRIEFRIRQKGIHKQFCPYFGFAVSSSASDLMSRLKTVRHWNDCYVKFKLENDKECSGYSISMYNSTRRFQWNGCGTIDHEEVSMDVNDTFMLEHDFDAAECSAYHKRKKFHTFKMTEKCIIPTLSMYFEGERIQVTKYEFQY